MKYLLTALLCSIVTLHSTAQDTTDSDTAGRFHYEAAALAIGTANGQVPFWMRTNQYGNIPEHGLSAGLEVAVARGYKQEGVLSAKPDWGIGLEGRANIGRRTNFRFIEAYAKVRWSLFQLKAGRSRELMGMADPDLSSGNFSISGNALGIPKVELSIPDYWNLPYTGGWVAVKGSFAYGLPGQAAVNQDIAAQEKVTTLYHQKSLYIRLGREQSRLQLSGGINHQVMWGGEKQIFGDYYTLSGAKTVLYATIGKAYGNDSIPRSKIGNHIGSIDQALSLSFKGTTLRLYHQFFYEVGGLYHLNNIKDGLWGVVLQNNSEERYTWGWQKLLLEFLYTKSQGGELDAKVTPSGDEDYYNNYLYVKGWTYQEENLGNNFLTNKKYQRSELPQQPHEYIGNNRVLLLHLGALLNYKVWDIRTRLSYSANYGTYATSPVGISTGGKRQVFDPPYFRKTDQFSGSLEASRPLKKGYSIGFVLAADYGDLLYRSVGGSVRLSKKW